MKREIQIHVDCGEGFNYDYDVICDENENIELKRSYSSEWTNPGETIITCKENVKQGEYTIKISGQKINLNYAEAFELLCMLLYLDDGNKVKILEATTLKEI